MSQNRIILAADGLDLRQCLELASKTQGLIHAIKIHSLYDEVGPSVIETLKQHGAELVWVDVKLHDIPNTVKLRAQVLAKYGADIITVHASGGAEMIEAAVDGAGPNTKVYAVTVLTSLNEDQVCLIYGQSTRPAVMTLAASAKASGAHGIVCSAQEVTMFSSCDEFHGMDLVVPGIRSAGQDIGDQKRVDTPAAAILAGATYLVIGRQITQATDPVAAIRDIELEISANLR